MAYISSSGYKSVNVCGWISGDGPGEIVQIGSRFNSIEYVNILDSVLLPSISALYSDDHQFTFVQDNCPVHTSNIVKEWFALHPRISVLPWPAKSAT